MPPSNPLSSRVNASVALVPAEHLHAMLPLYAMLAGIAPSLDPILAYLVDLSKS